MSQVAHIQTRQAARDEKATKAYDKRKNYIFNGYGDVMKKQLSFLLALVLGLTLAACGSTSTPVAPDPSATAEPSSSAQPPEQAGSQEMLRSDAQGAITFDVEPTNLSNPGAELTFEISMDTHSVDLSMDLADLATLTTNNGNMVQASLWDAPRGGHHVSGMLSFPASVDGKPLLDGATTLTLTIKDVDAPERVFTWDLGK